jgi:DNA-binding MarR family transcriptional regulator
MFLEVNRMSEKSHAGQQHLQSCACGNLRRTTRIVTQYYDRFLQPSGLRSTQFSLLHSISVNENCSVGDLAKILLMDQTTVTRNLELLRKRGYICVIKKDSDARRRTVSLTETGAQKLEEAIPMWLDAQSQVEQRLGGERFGDFLNLLRELVRIAQ